MSTVNVRPSKDASGSVSYVLYGNSKDRKTQLLVDGKTRASAIAISMEGDSSTPAEFVARAENLAHAHGRKNQLYSYVLAFHPDEFDVTAQTDLDQVRDVAAELAERMHSADYMVVVHADSAGGHAHAHILVINHDNLTGGSLQRYTSWRHGLHQLNDELMEDEGLQVLPDPTEPKPDWELRRESFTTGGFEQILGDKVYTALADPRSTAQDKFEEVLAEHGVTLVVTNRDGWTFKMRREDNGKLGRKKASGLSPEFTKEGADRIFSYHSQKGKDDGITRRNDGEGRSGGKYGRVARKVTGYRGTINSVNGSDERKHPELEAARRKHREAHRIADRLTAARAAFVAQRTGQGSRNDVGDTGGEQHRGATKRNQVKAVRLRSIQARERYPERTQETDLSL